MTNSVTIQQLENNQGRTHCSSPQYFGDVGLSQLSCLGIQISSCLGMALPNLVLPQRFSSSCSPLAPLSSPAAAWRGELEAQKGTFTNEEQFTRSSNEIREPTVTATLLMSNCTGQVNDSHVIPRNRRYPIPPSATLTWLEGTLSVQKRVPFPHLQQRSGTG